MTETDEELLLKPFKPAVILFEESGVVEAITKDCQTVARPLFNGMYHFADGMYDNGGKLVGVQIWLPEETAARIRALSAEVEALERVLDFVVLWTHRGPPHGGPGNEATCLDAIKYHPTIRKRALRLLR